MQTKDAVRARRAVKHYDPAFKIPDEHINELLDLVRQAPTSFNLQNWRIINVASPDLRTKLREVGWDQAQITDASHLLIICGDIKAFEKNPARYWEDAPQEAQEMLVPMIGTFYDGREWMQRDEAFRSIGIISQTLMLAAKAMDYDSCPMVGFDFDAVAKMINLPDDHVIGMMVAIGKATTPAQPKGGYLPLDELVLTDSF